MCQRPALVSEYSVYGKDCFMGFSMSEAARLLNISTRTLNSWLADEDFVVDTDPVDRRSRALTLDQLERVAIKHKRELDFTRIVGHGRQDGEPSLSAFYRRLAQLEEQVADLRSVLNLNGSARPD